MTTAGSPANPDHSTDDRRIKGSRQDPLAPTRASAATTPAEHLANQVTNDLDRFLADAARRRARHTREEPARPAEWGDPDPDAMRRLPVGSHPIDRATRRLLNDKCRRHFLSDLRRVCERLQGLEPRSLTADQVRDYPWHHINPEMAADFRKAIYARFTNQGTRNDQVSMVRRIITQVYKAGLISALRRDLVLEQLWTIAPGPSGRRRRLAQDEINDLLDACERVGSPQAIARNAAIVALFRTSGMRVSELCRLNLVDWDRSEQTLLLRDTKNGSSHLVYLHPDAVPYMERWLQARGAEPGQLFQRLTRPHLGRLGPEGVRYMLRNKAKEAGVAPFGSHDFRRTFATELLRRRDIALVGKLLNHRKTASTLIYDMADEDDLRDAVAMIELPGLKQPAPTRRPRRSGNDMGQGAVA